MDTRVYVINASVRHDKVQERLFDSLKLSDYEFRWRDIHERSDDAVSILKEAVEFAQIIFLLVSRKMTQPSNLFRTTIAT